MGTEAREGGGQRGQEEPSVTRQHCPPSLWAHDGAGGVMLCLSLRPSLSLYLTEAILSLNLNLNLILSMSPELNLI